LQPPPITKTRYKKVVRAWRLLLTVLALYTPAVARANGRFPKAQAIATVPGGDGRTIWLRATFGLLVSRDAGATWDWTCEQALGFSGTWDPPIAATKDGRLWAGLPNGLRIVDGCEGRDVRELAGELVADVSVEQSLDRVALVTSTPGKPSYVWRQKKPGAPFERLGNGVPGLSFDTIEVARSNARRLYATASPVGAGKRAHLFRSDDGGTTLLEIDVPLEKDGRLLISAIDPEDDKRVLLRHSNASGTDLLLSTDAGATFKAVLHTSSSMFGFAGDGTVYYAGAGDAAEGVFRSRDRGETWERTATQGVLCLHVDGPRLFACSNPYTLGGWAAAISTDRGASFRPLATFEDARGPVPCDAGAVASCAAYWPEVRAQITARVDGGSPARAEPDAASAPRAVAPAAGRKGCGCDMHAEGSAPGALAILLVVACARRRLDPS
jgi:hypothetical protein